MNLPVPVQIIGVNQWDKATANDDMCDGRDLPWLQDTETADVWNLWPHEYRDVVIVGADNVRVGVFNVTNQDLSDPMFYNMLRQMFVDASMAAAAQ